MAKKTKNKGLKKILMAGLLGTVIGLLVAPKSKKKSKKKGKVEISSVKDIKPDNYVEKAVRSEAVKSASGSLHTVYDIYKKAHGMASLPYVDEAEAKVPQTGSDKLFGFK